MNEPHGRESLDWSAFCYLAGELTGQEHEDFEALLAESQNAREALARAVELTQTVAAVESHAGVVAPAALAESGWRVRLAWMAMGAAAALLAALMLSTARPTPHATASRETLADERLAAAWTATRAALASARDEGAWPAGPILLAEATDEPLLANDALFDDLATIETPSWMTAAVIEHIGRSVDTEPPFSRRGLEN